MTPSDIDRYRQQLERLKVRVAFGQHRRCGIFAVMRGFLASSVR